MRYCQNCGAVMGDADKFFPSCGAKAEFTDRSSNAGPQAYGTAGSGAYGQNASGNGSRPYESTRTNAGAGDFGPAQEGTGGQQTWQQTAGQNAGAYADPGAYHPGFQYDPVGSVDMLVSKMRSLSTAWLVIGIIQIIIGTVTICAVVGLAPLIMGIYNVVQSSNVRKQAESFQQWPVGIIKYFEARETSVIVILILNIFFGLLFGIVGSILEFTTKSYAMDHREELRMAEEMANRSAQVN